MINIINGFLMILVIMSGTFMMTRYVFLEQGMEEKKQRLFYIVSFGLVLLVYFMEVYFMEYTGFVASLFSMLLGGLNIFLGRRKRRLLGMLLMFPLSGLMNGIASPIIAVRLFGSVNFWDETLSQILEMALYILVAASFLVFYLKGKEWRRWFRDNMKNRRPLPSEYIVLCVSGVLLQFTNMVTQRVLEKGNALQSGIKFYLILISCYWVVIFLVSITVVVLIMQGNKRQFYLDRVSDMQFSVIATMADIVENRDSNTGGHIKRTAKYVEIIGKNLKKRNAFPEILTDEYMADMIVAAPLHDIGKISIPDAILNKPGRLTDEEFAIMKTHAAAGRDVLLKAENQLGEFNYLEVALDMAEYHHEWWNGKGYPNGISGEEIPLCARIMAVADVFDALTSKRCYKEAMPLEKAYGIIREETGTHFDPVVAEAFLNARKEIEDAIEKLAREEAGGY